MTGKREEATQQFEIAEKLDPNLAAAHFQLYTAYRQAGQAPLMRRANWSSLSRSKSGRRAHRSRRMWKRNDYTEIYDPTEPGFVPDPRVTLRERILAAPRRSWGLPWLAATLLAWSDQGMSTLSERHGLGKPTAA